MIEQISVYTENKKGAMRSLLGTLTEADINVLAFVNNDSAEFGTVRLVVSDTAEALRVLSEKGYLCRSGWVVGVELDDKPGALQSLLAVPEQMNVNVNYMYLGYRRENGMPLILLSCEDVDIVNQRLQAAGYTVY